MRGLFHRRFPTDMCAVCLLHCLSLLWVKKYGHLYPVVQVSLGFHFPILFQEGEGAHDTSPLHFLKRIRVLICRITLARSNGQTRRLLLGYYFLGVDKTVHFEPCLETGKREGDKGV